MDNREVNLDKTKELTTKDKEKSVLMLLDKELFKEAKVILDIREDTSSREKWLKERFKFISGSDICKI